MNKQILLDMDGVLADFITGAAILHDRDPAAVKTWVFFAAWDLNPADFWATLGYEFWANVPFTPEASGVIKLCEDAIGSENVCLLSSPCETDGCLQGKMDWIRKHLPQYSRRFLFGPAKQFCSGPDRLLVDDSDANCGAFRAAGGSAFLFPRPWNENRFCDSPIEALRLFLRDFGDGR